MVVRWLQAIIIISITSSAFASNNISISAKESEDHIFLIFHYDRKAIINPSFLGKNGRIRSDKPLTIKPNNIPLVGELCNAILLNPQNPHIIDFKLNDKYNFLNIIYGEKLVAFKINNPDYQGANPDISKKNKEVDIKPTEVKVVNASNIPSKDKQNADTLVSLKEANNVIELGFSFNELNVGAAVFQRGNDLWIVFDSRKDFYIPQNSTIGSWYQYTDLNNTILKLSLKKKLSPQAIKRGNSWFVNLTSSKGKVQNNLTTETKNDSLMLIHDVVGVKQLITVRDRDIGDLLVIVPISKSNSALTNEKNFVDYKILKAAQGVAISLTSEATKVHYSDKSKNIEIVSDYKLAEKSNMIHDSASYNTILPSSILSMFGDDYLTHKNVMTRAMANATDNNTKFSTQLDLAQFYFANAMYYESLAILNLAKKTDTKKASLLLPSFMQAVNMVLTADYIDARAIFADLQNNYKNSPSLDEISIWERYNEYMNGAHPENIGILENPNLLKQYNDEFYWKFMLAELEIATEKKNFKSIDQLLAAARKSNDLYINNNLKFFKAQYYYLQNQNNLAEQLLKEIEANPAGGRDYMMADLQLVRMLYEQHKLDWVSAVQKLHELRFVWRGDDLELKLLMSLALAYEQNGDVLNAIRTYKYVLDSFGKQGTNSFFITSKIVELYNRIFLSNEMQELDDFSVIALFYEFKDFTPIGAEGDKAVLSIARRMLNLDLLDMATDILQHQVTYRLRGVDRIITANHLALVYLMDKKPAEAIRVMEETDKENINFNEYKQRIELKAKALVDLGKYQEALDYLKDDPSEDAIALRSEAYFRGNKWIDYINLVESNLKQRIADGDVIKGEQSQDVLRLAISYSMLNRTADLEYLNSHIVTENKDLKTVIEFLKDTNKPVNPHSIDKSLNMDRMKHFVEHQKELLFN